MIKPPPVVFNGRCKELATPENGWSSLISEPGAGRRLNVRQLRTLPFIASQFKTGASVIFAAVPGKMPIGPSCHWPLSR
jgi:hypothetical protein